MTFEPRVESLRRTAQEFLDYWCPGTVVTVDWTGDAYLLQLARGYRLADPIWAPWNCIEDPDSHVRLRADILLTAAHLTSEA